jgi:hypothetical protein
MGALTTEERLHAPASRAGAAGGRGTGAGLYGGSECGCGRLRLGSKPEPRWRCAAGCTGCGSWARSPIGSIGGHKAYDLNPEGERILCDWAAREHGVEAICVHGFPRKKRPFDLQVRLPAARRVRHPAGAADP